MAKMSGYRTKNREMMLEYMRANKERTVYVSDIYAYMQEQGVNVNITTIYRFLDKLLEEHRVLKYASDKGESARFQYVEDGSCCKEHLHIKCDECGRVLHLDCTFMQEIRNHLEAHHHFQLECSGSNLSGICSACQEKKKNSK